MRVPHEIDVIWHDDGDAYKSLVGKISICSA